MVQSQQNGCKEGVYHVIFSASYNKKPLFRQNMHHSFRTCHMVHTRACPCTCTGCVPRKPCTQASLEEIAEKELWDRVSILLRRR